MPALSPYTKAALAAACLGLAVALFASAVHDIKVPCVDCGDAEEVAAEVAQASAELSDEMPE